MWLYIITYNILAAQWNNVITETRLFKYIENYITKNSKFSDKNSDFFFFFFFHISAQNIDYGYSLEPPLLVRTASPRRF